MNAGVDLRGLWARWPGGARERVETLIDRLAAEGLVSRDGSRVRLEHRGRLLADSIGSEVMAAFDPLAAMAAGSA
jgi:oxygen-independent coproporphyrinogen III oxidase